MTDISSALRSMIQIFVPFFVYCLLSASTALNEIEKFKEILSDEKSLIALFTEECCACTNCVEAEVLVGGMSQQIEENLNIYVVKLKDPTTRKLYGVKTVPSLVFFRDEKPILFDGNFDLETLFAWLQENSKPYTKDLDDDNFEHLTQAASGATTGDWLVAFYENSDSCIMENDLILHMEGAGKRLKHKINVALVNGKNSRDLFRRFKVQKCPEILLFRLGKMYRFSLPEISTSILVRYAEGFYRNSKPELVPLPKSPFDNFVEMAYQNMKTYWFEIACFSVILLFLVVLCLIASVLKNTKKEKSE